MTDIRNTDFLGYPSPKKLPIIKGLQPFEKILVRNAPDTYWRPRFFSHYAEDGNSGTYAYAVTTGSHYPLALRYAGNEKYANTAFEAEFADTPQDARQDAPQEGEKFKLIEIKSRPGTFIKLDDDVADKIGGWGWWLNEKGYAKAHLPGRKGKKVRLSRAVIWAVTGQWPDKGMEVDHINHDILDNRIENLRVVTRSLNDRNQLKRKGTASKYKGVFFHKNRPQKTWIGKCGLRIDGKKNFYMGFGNIRRTTKR